MKPSHPNSLANLKPFAEGNKTRYSGNKKKRNISVTDESWKTVRPLLKAEYGLSVSEMVELVGRGKYVLKKVEDDN